MTKPHTFINLSGESVGYLLARFGGRPADLVVVYDEMALPLGRIRLRAEYRRNLGWEGWTEARQLLEPERLAAAIRWAQRIMVARPDKPSYLLS